MAARGFGPLVHGLARRVRLARYIAVQRLARPGAAGPTPDASVALVFAGGRRQVYQAYQWLWPLERLDLRLRATGRAGVEIVW